MNCYEHNFLLCNNNTCANPALKLLPLFISVRQVLLILLLAAAVGCGQVLDRTLSLSNERSSIERTYELTKYLDHQLKEIRDTYVRCHLFISVCVNICDLCGCF